MIYSTNNLKNNEVIMAYSNYRFSLQDSRQKYQFKSPDLPRLIDKFKRDYQLQITAKNFEVLRELFYALTQLSRHYSFHKNHHDSLRISLEALEIGHKILEQVRTNKLIRAIKIEIGNIHQALADVYIKLKSSSSDSSQQFQYAKLAYTHAFEAYHGENFDENSKAHRKMQLLNACDAFAHAAINNRQLSLGEKLCKEVDELNKSHDGKIIDKRIHLYNLLNHAYLYYLNRDCLQLRGLNQSQSSDLNYKYITEAYQFYLHLVASPNQEDQFLAHEKQIAIERLLLDSSIGHMGLLIDSGITEANQSKISFAINIGQWFIKNIDDSHFQDRLDHYADLTEHLAKASLQINAYKDALKYYIQSYKMRSQNSQLETKQKSDLFHMISLCQLKVGQQYAIDGDIATAFKFYSNAVKSAKVHQDLRKMADAYESIAELYTHPTKYNPEKAKAFIKLAIKALKEYIANNFENGRELLEGLAPAPDYFTHFTRLRSLSRRAHFDIRRGSSHEDILRIVNTQQDIVTFPGCTRKIIASSHLDASPPVLQPSLPRQHLPIQPVSAMIRRGFPSVSVPQLTDRPLAQTARPMSRAEEGSSETALGVHYLHDKKPHSSDTKRHRTR